MALFSLPPLLRPTQQAASDLYVLFRVHAAPVPFTRAALGCGGSCQPGSAICRGADVPRMRRN